MRRLVEIWSALRELDWEGFIEEEAAEKSRIMHWVEQCVESWHYEGLRIRVMGALRGA